MGKKLIVANWKMNPASEKEAVRLAKSIDKSGVVVAAPFVFLPALSKVLRRASLGAQDVFWEESGAYTGEVSSKMLRGMGVKYVIVGHSERRKYLGETDVMINFKIKAALRAGLKVILCVGEVLETRQKGLYAAKNFVEMQLSADLKGIRNRESGIRNVVIAYEPIWAIGTGKADDAEETTEMSKFIKNILNSEFHIHNSRVLYGGSVNSKNAAAFLALKEIDGALVGGASLKPKDFLKIVEAAQ